MPLWYGATEVTIGQFRKFVDEEKYTTDEERSPGLNVGGKPNTWRDPSPFPVTDDHPVSIVSWWDAIAFCNWLSKSEGLAPCYQLGEQDYQVLGGNGYRLPTEAEYEYACRAGTTTRFYWGDKFTDADEYAWTNRIAVVRSHPVATKKPNAFGLFDMAGNVWDMCQDVYEARAYKESALEDPLGPMKRSRDSKLVMRGGSWLVGPMYCRSACRHDTSLHFRFAANGFRVVRSIDPGEQR